MSKSEKTVIRVFARECLGLEVACWPDEAERRVPEIDAMAGCFAIEHSSVDALNNQRGHDVLFNQAVNGLDVKYRLADWRVTVVLPYRLLVPPVDISAVRVSLESMLGRLAEIPSGRTYHSLEGFSHDVMVSKRRPVTSAALLFARHIGHSDEMEFGSRVQSNVRRKLNKLVPYRAKGYTTLLLIEFGDVALMDPWRIGDVIRGAFGGLPKDLDSLWFADTAIKEEWIFSDFTDYVANDGPVEDRVWKPA